MQLRQLFLINLIVVLLCSLIVGFSWLVNRNALEGAGLSVFQAQGRAAFELIRAARHWNADTEGVYVPVSLDIHPNPYLHLPDRDITDNLGRQLTRINPAYMTRQISEQLEGQDVALRITSLKPLNPTNAPDEWERSALTWMEQSGELERVELFEGRYRYMAGLNIVHSCLPCHEQMGYKIGDLRGGISFTRDAKRMDPLVNGMLERVDSMHLWIWAVLVVCASVLASLTFGFWQRLMGSESVQQRLRSLVETDYLTGVLSRRELMSRLDQEVERTQRFASPLALMMIDLDHFKQVNDRFGHAQGDRVLIEVAQALQHELRKVDSIGRYGGEEFTVIVPNAESDDALSLAERLLQRVRELEFRAENGEYIQITISIGLVCNRDLSQVLTADSLLRGADQALYNAKHAGRNRVEQEHPSG